MVIRFSAFSLVIIPLLANATAAPAAAASPPPNTIDCRDWTHNPDGSWTAHDNAKAFDLGKAKQETVQGSTISPHSFTIDGMDLWSAVDQKCGGNR